MVVFIMDDINETALELGVDLACLSCLQNIGIDPHVALVLVFGGSTIGRLAIDFFRLKMREKNQRNQEDKQARKPTDTTSQK